MSEQISLAFDELISDIINLKNSSLTVKLITLSKVLDAIWQSTPYTNIIEAPYWREDAWSRLYAIKILLLDAEMKPLTEDELSAGFLGLRLSWSLIFNNFLHHATDSEKSGKLAQLISVNLN
jgi:hypothetical protein